jgi:hypothetical protein
MGLIAASLSGRLRLSARQQRQSSRYGATAPLSQGPLTQNLPSVPPLSSVPVPVLVPVSVVGVLEVQL